MKRMKIAAIAAALVLAPMSVQAGEWTFGGEFGVYSSYLWRGLENGGLSIQPDLNLSYQLDDVWSIDGDLWYNKSFQEAFGEEFTGDAYDELDLYIGATAGSLSFGITWDNEYLFRDYACNFLHANLEYGFDFGLGLQWSTVFLDNGYIDEDYCTIGSSYFEANYTYELGSFELCPAVGLVPWKSYYYDDVEKFHFINMALDCTYTLDFDKGWTLPLTATAMYNPNAGDFFWAIGAKISF